jgi:hypothetical protein
MDSSAAVTTRAKQYMEQHGECSYMYMRRSYRKKTRHNSGVTTTTNNKKNTEQRDQCSYI